jgi:hypothetical protein
MQTACSAGAAGQLQPAPGGLTPAGLPGLPADRQAKVLTPHAILGKATDSRSATGVTTSGNALALAAPAGGLAWAIYRFTPGSSPLATLGVDAALTSGAGLYLGLANYGSGRWEFRGPLAPSQLQSVALSPAYVSPLGNFYCLVVAHDAAAATVNQLTLTTDDPAAQFDVSGKVASAAAALSGVTLTLTGRGTVQTGTDGTFTFTGVPNGSYTLTPSLGGYSFTPPSRTVTVSGAGVTGQDFTAVQAVTYTSTIQGLLAYNCVGCHGSGQAYGGIRLDSYAQAKQNGANANAAIQNDVMPLGGPPLSAALKAEFQAWVDAGFPQ